MVWVLKLSDDLDASIILFYKNTLSHLAATLPSPGDSSSVALVPRYKLTMTGPS